MFQRLSQTSIAKASASPWRCLDSALASASNTVFFLWAAAMVSNLHIARRHTPLDGIHAQVFKKYICISYWNSGKITGVWCSHYHLNFSASAGCFTVASKRFSVRCISCSSTLILPCLSTTCHRVILFIFLLCELELLGYPHNFQIQTLSIFFFYRKKKKPNTANLKFQFK